MGNSSSHSVEQDKLSLSPKGKHQQNSLSPKRILLNNNGQKIRQPDASLLKKNSINSLQNTKPELKSPKNHNLPTQTSKSYQNLSNEEPINKLSNSQLSIGLVQSQCLSNNKDFVNSLWNLLFQQSQVNPQLTLESFSSLILATIEAINLKFDTKIKNCQIHPIFSTSQSQKNFQKDVRVFEITLKNRIKNYFSTSKTHSNHSEVEKYKQQLKQIIQQQGNTIICQLMGKTSIWRSLMLSRQDQQTKIIQMLQSQGIDQKHLNEITQSKTI